MVKKVVLKNIDLYTEAGELEQTAPDKRKDKCTPAEKVRRNRHRQKEVVRQIILEFKKLSKRDEDEELHDSHDEDKNKTDRVFYTMKPVI